MTECRTGLILSPRWEAELAHVQMLGSPVWLPWVSNQLPEIVKPIPTPPVLQQRFQDCVPCALVTAMAAQLGCLEGSCLFSPLSLYNRINNGHDYGSSLAMAVRALRLWGVCTTDRMPYAGPGAPTWESLVPSTPYVIAGYRCVLPSRPGNVNLIKRELAKGQIVIIGMSVGDDWRNYRSGVIEGESHPTGAHAVILTGYDSNVYDVDDVFVGDVFRGQNSWGRTWGERGMFRVSADCIRRSHYTAWVVDTSKYGYWGGRLGT